MVPTVLVNVRVAPVMVTGPVKIRSFSLVIVKKVVLACKVTVLPTVKDAPLPLRISPPASTKGVAPAPKGPSVGDPAIPVELMLIATRLPAFSVVPPVYVLAPPGTQSPVKVPFTITAPAPLITPEVITRPAP